MASIYSPTTTWLGNTSATTMQYTWAPTIVQQTSTPKAVVKPAPSTAISQLFDEVESVAKIGRKLLAVV